MVADESAEPKVCIECANQDMCRRCNSTNLYQCFECFEPFKLVEGICKAGCPSGYKQSPDGSFCYSLAVNDIGIFPFPFLIVAFFGCLIAIFGLCKKKSGRTKYISTQNTLTSFIVIVAFIQFLAVVALVVWAYLFETMKLVFGGLLVLTLMILLNITFFIFFKCTFNRKKTQKNMNRKFKQG